MSSDLDYLLSYLVIIHNDILIPLQFFISFNSCIIGGGAYGCDILSEEGERSVFVLSDDPLLDSIDPDLCI